MTLVCWTVHSTRHESPTEPSFESGNPSTIIDGPYLGGNGYLYDVSADGQRFLMIKQTETSDEASVPAEDVIVENWTEELKRLVPTE